MGIIAFIILGLLAGAIAKAIMPGDDPGGFIVTAIIGVVGALLGGFVAAALVRRAPARRVLRHLDVADGHCRGDRSARDLPPRCGSRRTRPHPAHLMLFGDRDATRGVPIAIGCSRFSRPVGRRAPLGRSRGSRTSGRVPNGRGSRRRRSARPPSVSAMTDSRPSRTVSGDPTYERLSTFETWAFSAGDQCASMSSTGGGS